MSKSLLSRPRILDGNIAAEMLRFGTPIAFGMGMQTTFSLVDIYILSQLDPETAGPTLGALCICDQLTIIGTIVSYGITTASTAMVARAHRRSDPTLVRRIVWQSILAIGALSLLFGLSSILFSESIPSHVIGTHGKVSELGAAYLRLSFGGAFSIFFLLQFTSIQRALGSSKMPAALLTISHILRFFFTVLFVYGPGKAPWVFLWAPRIAAALHIPRMELVGAAWAAVISRVIVLIPTIVLMVYRCDVIDRKSITGPDLPMLKDIWGLGWPSSIRYVNRIVAMLITQSIVARAFTTAEDQTATIALGIALRLEATALLTSMGWGSAAQTFVARNLAVSQIERAQASSYWAAGYNAIMMLAIAVTYRHGAHKIISLFQVNQPVMASAEGYLDVVSWGYVGLGTAVVLGTAMSGAGATGTALVTDLALILGVQLPVCSVAVLLAHPTPFRLSLAVAATYMASGVVYLLVSRMTRWAGRSVFGGLTLWS